MHICFFVEIKQCKSTCEGKTLIRKWTNYFPKLLPLLNEFFNNNPPVVKGLICLLLFSCKFSQPFTNLPMQCEACCATGASYKTLLLSKKWTKQPNPNLLHMLASFWICLIVCSSQCLKSSVTLQNVFHEELQGALIHCFVRNKCYK